MKLLLACALGLVVLSGCDNRPCLRSHQEMIMMTQPNGNGGVIVIPQWYTVCDKYGPEPVVTSHA